MVDQPTLLLFLRSFFVLIALFFGFCALLFWVWGVLCVGVMAETVAKPSPLPYQNRKGLREWDIHEVGQWLQVSSFYYYYYYYYYYYFFFLFNFL